jgi:predicted RNA-binding protein with PIN domain
VARAGLGETPPVPPPKGVAPILRFRRPLPAPALVSVRRALDEDDAFRERVRAAAEADAGVVGEAGHLLLDRPEGWLEALAALEDAASAAASAAADAGEERSARRRLRSVEAAARTAEDRVRALQAEVVELRGQLAAARRAEAAAGEARAAALAKVRGLEKERDAAHKKVAALDSELARRAREPAAPQPAPSEAAEEAAPFPIEELRSAVDDALAAAARLGEALEAATAVLDAGAPAGAAERDPARRRRTDRSRAGPANVRLPAALPPGLYDDDPAAAAHLVRVAGCVLVVDGYNASLRRWPDQPIAEQRRRLVDALAGLAARTGAQVRVVFDGADDEATTGGDGRRGVRVTFSAGAVEADQVILELVERSPAPVPVVVATDDRRVRREAAARGANVVSQEQLFSLL